MNIRLHHWVNRLVRLFRLSLYIYPHRMQQNYAAEMQAVFRLKAEDAAHKGARSLFSLAWREARDLPFAVLSAHFHAVRGRMKIIFPDTSDQTPRLAALLSLLPFIIAGPLRIIISYQSGWRPVEASYNYFWFLLSSFLIVAVGFGIGILKKFPRWSYPYPFFLAFIFYFLIIYANYIFQWNIRLVNSFFLYILLILVLFWLPPLRSFYRRIPKDWTLLTYGLFALVLFLLSGVDFDETPQLNLLALVPSLLTLSAAYAHMRIPSVFLRTVGLLAALYSGLLLWLYPVFTSMVTIWIGIGIGLLMMLAYGISLTLILLAPLLVMRVIHYWQSNRVSQAAQ